MTRLHGVGPATAARLASLSITTCADLQRLPLTQLVQEFGKFGRRLFELARGIDDRPVRLERERKSVSVETTFAQDLPDLAHCHAALAPLCERLKARLARHGHPPLAGLFVKVRFDDFGLTTLEGRGALPALETFSALLDQAWARRERPVRLLGVGVRLVPEGARRQLALNL